MEITLSAVTYKDWAAIVKKACDQAKRGNHQARKFLADYLLGPPPQRMDVTTKGESLNERGVSADAHGRALALLADAFRGELLSGDSGESGAMGSAEQAAS